ncbi:MAG: DUF4469 domain-containing protein [Anaerolineaceae bacterium]|nr:DUF4469 domain-containing protein [Anaerolineaceae bacterium]MCB9099786.1 DUF4469 domain-containing protein [Anaerolineales bacterium]
MNAQLHVVKSNYKAEGEETYHAKIKHSDTLTQEDLLEEMAWHHSTLTKTDMRAFLESQEKTIIRALLQGKRVVTNLVHYKLSAKGIFTDENDQFDEDRHTLSASVSLGPGLRQAINNKTVTLKRGQSVQPVPRLDSYTNLHNSDPNTVLTPTYNARLDGDKLRFDPADPEQGVFLIPMADETGLLADRTPIRVTDYVQTDSNRTVIFRVPDGLAAGAYKLELRRRFGKTRLATATLQNALVVT